MWRNSSPDNQIELQIEQDNSGLKYQVFFAGVAIVQESRIEIETSEKINLASIVFQKESKKEIMEEYSLPAGKKEVYKNHAMETKLKFSYDNGEFVLETKVFNDGVAFRYGIEADNAKKITIYSEKTNFVLSEEFKKMWLQTWVNTYEGPYLSTSWEEAKDKHYGMPSLFHAKETGHWLMLTEAMLWNTNGGYCSSHLVGKGKNCMELEFAPEQTEFMETNSSFFTPWRIITATKELNVLVNSTINYNVNPASSLRDISWIKPGRNIWSWWSFENGAQLYSEQKRYVDFAAAFGFESITVDAGWDDTWVKDLCDYARKRKVSVWLWSDMQAVDTLEKAKEKIPKWAQWGVVGLKVDFFMNDSQHTMWQYNMIADIMTENKLMINFHGSTKPAGEGRTYPNLMTEEGIMGLEHYKWSDMPNALHNCTVPFTRNVVGSMDYTVTGISNRNRNTTQAHQLATSIIFESSTQHLADSIYSYEPWVGTDFLRRSYGTYDEVKLLAGYPGEYVVMMRRKGNEWFVGGITTEKRTIEVDLSFLTKDCVQIESYQDNGEQTALEKTVQQVKKTDKIPVTMQENGGFAMYIVCKLPLLQEGICEYYMQKPWIILYSQTSDKEAAFYSEIMAERSGRQTIRICYETENDTSLEVLVNNKAMVISVEHSGLKGIARMVDVIVTLQKGKNELQLLLKEKGKINYVQVIEYAENEEDYYQAKQAKLSGSAKVELVPGKQSEWSIQGIGEEGTALYDQVEVGQSGEYMLLLDYYSGENRYLEIVVNEEEAITTVLFNSSGWGPSRWDIIARKEVKIMLDKGKNKILIQGNVDGPHIGRIGIRLEK